MSYTCQLSVCFVEKGGLWEKNDSRHTYMILMCQTTGQNTVSSKSRICAKEKKSVCRFHCTQTMCDGSKPT